MNDLEQNQRLSRVNGVSVSARARLEGQVEVLERAIEITAHAVDQLARSVRLPQGVSEAAQVDAATVKAHSAAQRLAREDRSVLTVISALSSQRVKFRAAVAARAKLLRLPVELPPSELVARIEREPLVYVQTRGRWLAALSAGLTVVSVVGAVASGVPHSPSSSVFVTFAVLGALGVDHWWASRLEIVLTDQRLCVGRYEFELSSLKRVAVVNRQRVFRRRTKLLEITTTLGRTIELPITRVPPGFAAAVRSVGLEWHESSWWVND